MAPVQPRPNPRARTGVWRSKAALLVVAAVLSALSLGVTATAATAASARSERVTAAQLKRLAAQSFKANRSADRSYKRSRDRSHGGGSHSDRPKHDDSNADGPILDRNLIFRAQPDECFTFIGGPRPPVSDDGTCPPGSQPKVNQAYIWSAGQTGDWVISGTGTNALCFGGTAFGATQPYLTEANVCEYGRSQEAATFGDVNGDTRMPQVYRINSNTDRVENITATAAGDPNFQRTFGLRGGWGHDDVVMLFGQIVAPDGTISGLGEYAWQASTGRYLGSQVDSTLGGQRVGVEASDGNLYFGVRRTRPQFGGEVVYRWTGSVRDPFRFEPVANLPDTEAAYIIEHEGRLVVTGWAAQHPETGGDVTNGPAKIWISPRLGRDGLTSADEDSWRAIFSYDQYDPDPVIGRSMFWGAAASWHGHLIVGSYQIDSPLTSVKSLWREYGTPATEIERIRDSVNSRRPVSIFDITNAGQPDQQIKLLYGSYRWTVRDPSGGWTRQTNLLGQRPALGPAGFGNPFNWYTWTAHVFDDKLYFATFDASGVVAPSAPIGAQTLDLSPATEQLFERILGPELQDTLGGGDLWRMDSLQKPAVAEDLNGYGDRSSHGIRVIASYPDKGFFYAGTAADHNLRWGGENPGGFEFLKFAPGREREPLTQEQPDPTALLATGVGAPG